MINPPGAYHNGGVNENLTPAATKLGQGNVFTGVCDSVHRRVSASVHPGIHPPGADTPQSRLPPEQTPPTPSRHPLGADTPPGADPPGTDPPWEQTPPRKKTQAYGQRAAGTHPTGMHSCWT